MKDKSEIIKKFSESSIEIFNEAKDISLQYRGKMNSYHLLWAFLKKENNFLKYILPAHTIIKMIKNKGNFKKKSPNNTLVVTKEIQKVLKIAVKIRDKNRNKKVTPPELFSALIKEHNIKELLKDYGEKISKYEMEMIKTGYDEKKYNIIKSLNLLDKYAKRTIPGQSEACKKVMSILRMVKLGLDLKPERPDGVFLFVGPIGTGKYSMAKAVAKYFSKSEFNLLNIDMDLYQDAWDFDKFLNLLSQNIKDNRNTSDFGGVVVFNKIDLAHPSVVNFLSDALNKGSFAGSDGENHSFSKHTIIFIPSDKLSEKHDKIGFIKSVKTPDENYLRGIQRAVLTCIDDIVLFKKLKPKHLEKVARSNIMTVINRISKEYNIHIKYSDDVLEYIAAEALKMERGRREVNKLIDEYISLPIVNLFIEKGVSSILITMKHKKVSIVDRSSNGKK